MEENPEGVTALLRAKEIAHDLARAEKPQQAERLSEVIWAGVRERLEAAPAGQGGHTDGKGGIGRVSDADGYVYEMARRRRPAWYWVAAGLAGILLIGAGIVYYRPGDRPVAPVLPKVATVLVQQDLQRTNQTIKDQVVYLVDGSKVILQPGARIRHAVFLQKDKREVYLDGDAFFEVTKDAGRPFYVYTRDLMVRVLGTSFRVTTDKHSGDVLVQVRSGKVSVYHKTDPPQQQLILERDQQALYSEQTHHFVQSITDKQYLLPDSISIGRALPFHFEEAPVVNIFQTLEDAYGIPLHYDSKTFSSCVITTSLTDETFEEKLKIICEAIGATYRIKEDGVFIEGKPCK